MGLWINVCQTLLIISCRNVGNLKDVAELKNREQNSCVRIHVIAQTFSYDKSFGRTIYRVWISQKLSNF